MLFCFYHQLLYKDAERTSARAFKPQVARRGEALHPLHQKQGRYLSWDATTHLWARYEARQFIRPLSELMLNNWEFTASSSACAKTAAEMSLSQRYVFSQPLTFFFRRHGKHDSVRGPLLQSRWYGGAPLLEEWEDVRRRSRKGSVTAQRWAPSRGGLARRIYRPEIAAFLMQIELRVNPFMSHILFWSTGYKVTTQNENIERFSTRAETFWLPGTFKCLWNCVITPPVIINFM